MYYIYAVRDLYTAWAVIRRQPISRLRGVKVTFLGCCDEDQFAWDLFWAAHRLIADGQFGVPTQHQIEGTASEFVATEMVIRDRRGVTVKTLKNVCGSWEVQAVRRPRLGNAQGRVLVQHVNVGAGGQALVTGRVDRESRKQGGASKCRQ